MLRSTRHRFPLFAKNKLNETGKATLKAKLTFTPTGGATLTKPKSLTLKKKLD